MDKEAEDRLIARFKDEVKNLVLGDVPMHVLSNAAPYLVTLAAREKRRIERIEKLKTSVGGALILSILSGFGWFLTKVYEWWTIAQEAVSHHITK